MGSRVEFFRKMKWPFLAAAFWVAFIAWPPVPGRAQDESIYTSPNVALVQKLRVTQEGSGTGRHTRVVLDFDRTDKKTIDHRWFTLNNPARVVVDFPAIQFVTQPSLVDIPDGGMLKGMRAGLFRPGTVRMVVDLSAPARVSVFPIPAGASQGPRLVLDIAALKPGQKPTEVAPPADVVTTTPWSPKGVSATAVAQAANPPLVSVPGVEATATPGPAGDEDEGDKNAPVVPPQVVSQPGGPLVVALDAGHGGVDPGACSLGDCEKYLTLDMVKRVGAILKDHNIKVIFTRDKDEYIPLGERSRIAERAQANLFVSLHADSHPDRDVRGATVYMVSEKASDKEAARLADSENAGDVLAGVGFENESKEVQGILISLAQRDTLNNSHYLAGSVLTQIKDVTEVRKPEPLFAGFKVLKAPDVPSILVEMGYITSPVENRRFESSAYRAKLAGAIAQGIRNYLDHYVHLQTPAMMKNGAGISHEDDTPKKKKKRRAS